MKNRCILPLLLLLFGFAAGCGSDSDDGVGSAFVSGSTASDTGSSNAPAPTSADASSPAVTIMPGIPQARSPQDVVSTASNQTGIRILALGDSNVSGFNIDLAWPERLELNIGSFVDNAGTIGDGTDQSLAKLPNALAQQSYTHLILLSGSNDIIFGLDAGQAVLNLSAMIDIGLSQGLEVIIGTLPPLVGGSDGMNLARNQINQAILGATNLGAKVVDIGGAIPPELIQADGIHVNDQGHAVMSALFQDQL